MNMTRKTRDALDTSIRHWEENVERTKISSIDTGSNDCALCKLFVKNFCEGCPVARKTRQKGCAGSPWLAVSLAIGIHNRPVLVTDEIRAATQAELDFLRKIRRNTRLTKET